MNIGFVSTWFERGAAYVTKAYVSLLKENHNIFIYARGGEKYAKGDPNWDGNNVTWGLELIGDSINFHDLQKWIKKNNIDVIFFNEQKDITILYKLKKHLPHIKLGSYIDYYKENTIKDFFIYDFLICNTKRHFSVFKDHPQCYYVPWGTDIELFKPSSKNSNNNILTFFHSVGMSKRKGTDYVINAFIEGEIYKNAKLIIHTQIDLKDNFGINSSELSKYNIEVIQKTITSPGLYYLGDVYVYPTNLDGLGLTMYEALSCGLPIITTDNAPMNEIVSNENGYLVEVDYFKTRQDAYYWPLSVINMESLIEAYDYFVKSQGEIQQINERNRKEAIDKWDWSDRKNKINDIFEQTNIIVHDVKGIPVDNIRNVFVNKKNKIDNLIRMIGSTRLYDFFNRGHRIDKK